MSGDSRCVGQAGDLVDHDACASGVVRRPGRSRARNAGSRPSAPCFQIASNSSCEQGPLALHQVEPVLGTHHVVGGDPLQHGDLVQGLRRGRRGRRCGARADHSPWAASGGAVHAAAEDADQVAGEVLQRGEGTPAPVVRRHRATSPTARNRRNVSSRTSSLASGRYQSRTATQVACRSSRRVERLEVDPAADDAVLEVVHRVGDVVGEVHHLRLDAAPRSLDALAAASRRPAGRPRRRRTCVPAAGTRPGVLGAGVEGGPRQVEPDRPAVGVRGLRLEPGQDAQRLGVALEAAAVGARARRAPPRRCDRTAGARGRAPAPPSRRGRDGSRAGGRGRGRPGRPRGCG